MKTGKIVHVLFFIISAGIFSACQKEVRSDGPLSRDVFNVNINFKAIVDSLPLQFNTSYKNAFGEAYSVKTFKYYICQVDLVNTISNIVYHVNKNDYFLIDEGDPVTVTIAGKADANKYDRLAFTIGVDSTRNVSGAQTGGLDPAKGMFWTWNSGYIMAKLEGNSPLSNEPDHKIEYHIGGFKQSESTIKRISLPFPLSQTMEFLPGATSTITVTANVNTWFHGANELHIGVNPVCTTPGQLAKQIAENYAKMFNMAEVVNY